jgi:hypothetical protein
LPVDSYAVGPSPPHLQTRARETTQSLRAELLRILGRHTSLPSPIKTVASRQIPRPAQIWCCWLGLLEPTNETTGDIGLIITAVCFRNSR